MPKINKVPKVRVNNVKNKITLARTITVSLDMKSGDVTKEFSDKVLKLLLQASLYLESKAKLRCPVDLGRLRSSIRHAFLQQDETAIIMLVGTDVEYAAFQEMGTGRKRAAKYGVGRQTPWTYKNPKDGKWITTTGNKPRPYLYPSFLETKRLLIKNLEALVKAL